MTNDRLAEAKAFIEAHGAAKFKPFAYYDKHLDCIRVRIRDCSMVEIRMNPIFTMVTNAQSDQPVGFNIKGVRYLFENVGLAPKRVYQLTSILDAIAKVFPDEALQRVREVFKEFVEIEIDLDVTPALN